MDYSNQNLNYYDSQQYMYMNHDYGILNNMVKNSSNESRNRFVYVNQKFINHSAKILINPNFKQTVHINPNFKKPAKITIHVNPSILKLNEINNAVNINSHSVSNKCRDENTMKPKPIIVMKMQSVRVPEATKANVNYLKQERRKSVHTKYKIIHSEQGNLKQGSNFFKNIWKNVYRIDRTTKLKRPRKSRYSLQNNVINTSKKNLVQKNVQKKKCKYININGTLYKKTPNVLKKADLAKITSKQTNTNKSKILLIKGHLYKLDRYQKTLKRLSLRKDNILNSNQQRQNITTKLNNNRKKIILSERENYKKQILPSKMKKCNLPCPIYRKFGKCRGKETGKCIRVHNPNQVMLCTKFLQGACVDSNCLLSHKVSPEKMPTCKFFLDGLCTKEDCVYLHVKISAKADICKDFLEGFCEKAKDCDKRHQFLCPEFEKNGSCRRKHCQYPHGNVVRKSKFSDKVAKRISKKKRTLSDETSKITDYELGNKEVDKNVRYYVENLEGVVNSKLKFESENVFDGKSDINCNSGNGYNLKLLKRTQLGALPSYIPLGNGIIKLSNGVGT